MKGIIIAFRLTILYFCFGFGTGLKCYQCEYSGGKNSSNPDCNAEKLGQAYLKDCDAAKTHCMTVIGSKNVSNVVVPAVKRDCAPVQQKSQGCNTTEYPGFEMTPIPRVCFCPSGGCNSEMHNNTAPPMSMSIGRSYFSLPVLGLAVGQMSFRLQL